MKHLSANQPQEALAGLVDRVTYHNAENGFCVLRARARGHREVVTVVGHAATIAAGEWITASGEWVNDRTHGQQFKARFLRTSPPTSADGIEKYLSSGMIRGIGPAYARKLLRALGEKVQLIIVARCKPFCHGLNTLTITRPDQPSHIKRTHPPPRLVTQAIQERFEPASKIVFPI